MSSHHVPRLVEPALPLGEGLLPGVLALRCRLAKGIAVNPKGARFACYDMLMTIAPGMLLTIVSVLFNAIIVFLSLTGAMSTGIMVASSLSSILFCLLNYFIFMFMFGV